jgi:hypothetical protein
MISLDAWLLSIGIVWAVVVLFGAIAAIFNNLRE